MGGGKLTKAEIVADIHTTLGIRKNDIQSTIELFYEAVKADSACLSAA